MFNVVYQIYNVCNGRSYWGSAKNWKHRRNEHLSMLHRNKHHNPILQNAWNLYGEENFVLCVLHQFPTIEAAINCEQNYLDQFVGRECCYNIALKTDNPMLGKKHSTKTINKMREIKLGSKNPRFGQIINQETRKKLSISKIGKTSPHTSQRNLQNAKTFTFTLQHSSGHIFYIDNIPLRDVVQLTGIPRQNLRQLFLGILKSYKGWRCINV